MMRVYITGREISETTECLLSHMREFDIKETPDGAKWEEADFGEMQEMMDEL